MISFCEILRPGRHGMARNTVKSNEMSFGRTAHKRMKQSSCSIFRFEYIHLRGLWMTATLVAQIQIVYDDGVCHGGQGGLRTRNHSIQYSLENDLLYCIHGRKLYFQARIR